ncbi:hypothetical protein GCM10008101_27720 [Lysobacter xinjiangensis]|uniref:Uncharacterized protein n=1 Tax=Cognatilysobacter xinjiangensis TaxID=546892 RepID=A0ABQ3CDL0_9GAMM|nr:hypothetical protein GCM10008101_27720 [Lysobacter xinjiangensis]
MSSRTIMQEDYLYTVFDEKWNPSDSLEDALSVVEARDAKLLQRLHNPGYVSTADDRNHLCALLALQATRHPDILNRGAKRSRELGEVLANSHSYSLDEFTARMASFAVSEADAHDCYIVLRSRPREQLIAELTELTDLSPQAYQLPPQDALRAKPLVEAQLKSMELWLLDAPGTEAFVLGDTPIPQSDLHQGFSVPLSRSLAVLARPTQSIQPLLSRRSATASEIAEINQTQADNALHVVIGPSAALLNAIP